MKRLLLLSLLLVATIDFAADNCTPMAYTLQRTHNGTIYGTVWCNQESHANVTPAIPGIRWIIKEAGKCADGLCATTGCVISENEYAHIESHTDLLEKECTDGKLPTVDTSYTNDPPAEEIHRGPSDEYHN